MSMHGVFLAQGLLKLFAVQFCIHQMPEDQQVLVGHLPAKSLTGWLVGCAVKPNSPTPKTAGWRAYQVCGSVWTTGLWAGSAPAQSATSTKCSQEGGLAMRDAALFCNHCLKNEV